MQVLAEGLKRVSALGWGRLEQALDVQQRGAQLQELRSLRVRDHTHHRTADGNRRRTRELEELKKPESARETMQEQVSSKEGGGGELEKLERGPSKAKTVAAATQAEQQQQMKKMGLPRKGARAQPDPVQAISWLESASDKSM